MPDARVLEKGRDSVRSRLEAAQVDLVLLQKLAEVTPRDLKVFGSFCRIPGVRLEAAHDHCTLEGVSGFYQSFRLRRKGFDLAPYTRRLEAFYRSGTLVQSGR